MRASRCWRSCRPRTGAFVSTCPSRDFRLCPSARQILVGPATTAPPGSPRKISFISKEAEYTPPVIFSEQERAKLVFRVEAQPIGDYSLPIGLPVTVIPRDAARGHEP